VRGEDIRIIQEKHHREAMRHEDVLRAAARQSKGYTSAEGWIQEIPLRTGFTLQVRCWSDLGARLTHAEFAHCRKWGG